MQEQASSERTAAAAATGLSGWMTSATRLGPGPWIALILTGIAWFACDTLRVKWGPVSHGVRFYEMADVMVHPVRLFNSLGADRGGIDTLLFSGLCICVLIVPVLLSVRQSRRAWLGYCAPLVLMICVALILRSRTSGDPFQETALVDTLGNDVKHFANHVFRGASATVAQTVSVAPGGYLGMLSSFYLAWWGVTRIRRSIALQGAPQ